MSKRSWLIFLLVVIGLLVWVPPSPVIELIVENKPVLLGRYAQTHFIGLFLLTLLLWLAALLLWLTRRKPVAESVFAIVMVYFSTGLSGFVLVVGSGFVSKPRYVETAVNRVDADTGIALHGVVRHRPPNERYDLLQEDKPEQHRSYPSAPPGYPSFPVVLTTDEQGFRNRDVQQRYDMLAVGDSFVAGSHVSDDQGWTELLRKRLGTTLYNLGVSGSDPLVYLNNFVTVGRSFRPRTVLVMLYEGNDFRDAPLLPRGSAASTTVPSAPSRPPLDIAALAHASPVTAGLRRLSDEYLSVIGSGNPVPGYAETVGFMPLAVPTPAGTQYYSFEPKRLLYLGNSEQEFAASSDWRNVRDVLEQFVTLSRKDGFRLLFVYAPSTPHVVLPLVADAIPAEQLLNFARFGQKSLAVPAENYKRQVMARLDSQENVWRQWCVAAGQECISMTQALRAAAAAGQQVYYTYDQHWTPLGNAVVAGVVTDYLTAPPVR